jgi:hypothetical protein
MVPNARPRSPYGRGSGNAGSASQATNSTTSNQGSVFPAGPKWDSWTATEIRDLENVVNLADPLAVSNAMSRIKPNFVQSEWLKGSHRVAKDPRKFPTATPLQGVRANALAEYAAASVPLHVSDSWTYFGRALNAIAAGSTDIAKHLLYYAELRAMYALLARNGIVLLNMNNVAVLQGATQVIPFPSSSRSVERNEHQAIWVLFRHWAKSPQAVNFFSSTVRMRGISLGDWINRRPLQASVSSVLSGLLDRWGMDIARFSRDREARNEASYSPSRIRPDSPTISPAYVASMYRDVWELLEPGAGNKFESMDQYIARDVFQACAAQDSKRRKKRLPDGYTSFNTLWVDNVLGVGQGRSIAQFLDQHANTTSPGIILQSGVDKSAASMDEQLTSMVGRALILLRFATGAATDLLAQAGCGSHDVRFWKDDMLSTHGIRLPDQPQNDYSTLWPAVANAVDDIDLLDDETDPDEIALVNEELAFSFQLLSGFERVPAWAVS